MTQFTILIADNDPDSVAPAKEFFEREGFRVITAATPDEARRILQQNGTVDLGVIDLRLTYETRGDDTSGLTVTEETSPNIPKIIWTRYPTYEAVCRALGPRVDRLPPAVGFVPKQEGLEALLSAVRLALRPPPPALLANILRYFEVPGILRLPDRIKTVGPAEASRRAQQSFEAARKELAHLRDKESARASHHHIAGLVAAALGMIVIVVAIILVRQGPLANSALTLSGSLVIDAVSLLFFVREDAAHKRVKEHVAQVEDMYRVGTLLDICECIESPAERDKYRVKILDRILEKV